MGLGSQTSLGLIRPHHWSGRLRGSAERAALRGAQGPRKRGPCDPEETSFRLNQLPWDLTDPRQMIAREGGCSLSPHHPHALKI